MFLSSAARGLRGTRRGRKFRATCLIRALRQLRNSSVISVSRELRNSSVISVSRELHDSQLIGASRGHRDPRMLSVARRYRDPCALRGVLPAHGNLVSKDARRLWLLWACSCRRPSGCEH